MIKIVYFGTNEFSATVLQALATHQGFKVLAVITQPTRPAGRNQEPQPSPVKSMAEKLGLPVLEPETLKNFNVDTVGAENFLPLQSADVFIVYAYGLIIPQVILDLPKHGTLNIHPSLLPKYRGPTPIQSALINGKTETGVSIMKLDAQMDHGPIITQTKMAIEPNDTNLSLMKKLIDDAIPTILDILPKWVDGKIPAVQQNHDEATYCKMLSRDDGKVDWTKTSDQIYNLYRGLTPWPGIWTLWNGKRLKLLNIKKSSKQENNEAMKQFNNNPGIVITINNELLVACGTDFVGVEELQLEGKKPMTVKEFLNGYKNFVGSKLG